jgi:DNA-binding NarL/FixJ family response regulator
VDDHKAVRTGLRLLFGAQPDLAVIGEAESGERALDLVNTRAPDVILMDARLGGMDGFETTRRMRQLAPESQIVIFSVDERQTYPQFAREAGARAFVVKTSHSEHLLEALRGVAAR